MAEGQSTTVSETVEYRDLAPLGFAGYRVGSDGTVWTAWVKRGGTPGVSGSKIVIGDQWRQRVLTPQKSGHLLVTIRTGLRRYRNINVHSLVLEAFVGPRPHGMVCCHRDGNPANNRLDNLRWDTYEANEADKRIHGTHQDGERNHSSKLQPEQVIAIRAEYASGRVTYKQLAERFGVGAGAVGKIVNGERWKHLKQPEPGGAYGVRIELEGGA